MKLYHQFKLSVLLITLFILSLPGPAGGVEEYQWEASWPALFNVPHGIAIDTNSFVYVADTENHRIQKFTSEGVFISVWGSEGSGPGEFCIKRRVLSQHTRA